MIRYLALMVLASLAVPALAADGPQSAPAESADMKPLFNGKDLAGWDGDPRLWSVKDGILRGETTKENVIQDNTFLIRKDCVMQDFELRLSFRCEGGRNSGIQYRSKHITEGPVKNAWIVHGCQYEVRDQNVLPSVSGFIYDEGGKRSRVCLVGEKATWSADGEKTVADRLIDQAGYEQLFKLGDWNDAVIVAKGHHIQHYLNGRLILDFTDNDPSALREGIFALQLHAGAPMWAEFQNIRVRDIK